MTTLFMGGEMGAFIPSDSSAIEGTGTLSSGSYDSAFARCWVGGYGSASYIESAAFTETADIWIHFEIAQHSPTSSSTLRTVCTMVNGSGTEVFRLQSDNPFGGATATYQLQYWNGAAWTNLGSSFTATFHLQVIDIHLVANSVSGSGTVYFSGTQRSTGSADLSSIAGVAQFRGYGKTVGIGAQTGFSQVICSTTSTIGGRLFTVPVTGAGSDSAWTGTYANIDEVTYSDADFINSASANQVSTFAVTAPTLTGYVVQAVAVTARAKKGAAGPANLQLALRSSGTNYFSSSKALDAGYKAFVNIWDTDPATSAAWVNSAVSTLQPGVKSIT